jgi:tryptophan-rich sensory protein
MNRHISLVFFLLAVLAATAFGASFEAGAWYQDLNKPDWTPPDWFFGPAWAVIYLLMAVAAWRVWLSGQSMRTGALAWWLLILALNVTWSWLFFLLSRSAGVMMLPLAGWLLFVVYLNYAIWAMNRGGFGQLFG